MTPRPPPGRSALLLAVALAGSGCRTVAAGLDERADALLADYRARTPPTIEAPPPGPPPPWRPGQYTVHARTRGKRPLLERVAVARARDDAAVTLRLDRLGEGEQLTARLTLRRPPRPGEALGALVLEAWVKRGEAPEIHTADWAPPDVLALASAATTRPSGGAGGATLTVPAGRFLECSAGAHPAVPLSGVVQQRLGDELRELLEFGDDGGGALF